MAAEPPPKFEAFLSYCHEDQERVRSVHAALEQAHVRVWRDAGQIVGGDAWIKNIEAGLSQSNCVVLFNSRSALQSVWVQREWNVALALNKRIVPVRLDDADVPLLLKATEFVEFHDAGQLDTAVEGIMRGIRGTAASIVESRMESGPQTQSNPSVVGPDITILNRMIQSESSNERNLALARRCAAGMGLVAVIGLIIWAGATRNGWTAMLALTPLAISGAIAWVITSQLRSSRSAALRLTTIKDGIELYCPKQGPCAQFRTELEKILKQRAGIQEVSR